METDEGDVNSWKCNGSILPEIVSQLFNLPGFE